LEFILGLIASGVGAAGSPDRCHAPPLGEYGSNSIADWRHPSYPLCPRVKVRVILPSPSRCGAEGSGVSGDPGANDRPGWYSDREPKVGGDSVRSEFTPACPLRDLMWGGNGHQGARRCPLLARRCGGPTWRSDVDPGIVLEDLIPHPVAFPGGAGRGGDDRARCRGARVGGLRRGDGAGGRPEAGRCPRILGGVCAGEGRS
jgi:hypothetical protein